MRNAVAISRMLALPPRMNNSLSITGWYMRDIRIRFWMNSLSCSKADTFLPGRVANFSVMALTALAANHAGK
jgi:hypothetical protein